MAAATARTKDSMSPPPLGCGVMDGMTRLQTMCQQAMVKFFIRTDIATVIFDHVVAGRSPLAILIQIRMLLTRRYPPFIRADAQNVAQTGSPIEQQVNGVDERAYMSLNSPFTNHLSLERMVDMRDRQEKLG